MVFPPPSNNGDSPLQQERDFSDLSPERKEAAQKQARKWFLILLTSGLLMGLIVALGIVQLLQKFGLAAKPDHPLRIERYKN
ncbi:MAG: hypothetical protein ACKO5Q_10345 [Microcystaceae cyanobacterium]